MKSDRKENSIGIKSNKYNQNQRVQIVSKIEIMLHLKVKNKQGICRKECQNGGSTTSQIKKNLTVGNYKNFWRPNKKNIII